MCKYHTFVTMMLLLVSSLSYAGIFENSEHRGNWYVDSTVMSKHINPSEDYNESNFGLGVTYRYTQYLEYRVGYYKNSYSKHSNYALVNVIPYPYTKGNWNIDAGLNLGIIDGYQDTKIGNNGVSIGSVNLMVAPSVSIEYTPIRSKIIFILAGNALALQVSYRVK